jgi:hypothetical protein
MDPLGSTVGGFHGSALLGTQQTFWLHRKSTQPAQPAALWHLENPIAGLVNTDVAFVTEHHLIAIVAIG